MGTLTATSRLGAWPFPNPVEPGRPVVVCDPGLRTGVAIVDVAGKVYGAEADWDDALVYVQQFLVQHVPYRPAIVCEAFVINSSTAKNSQAPWSLEGIGVLRFLARRHGAELVEPLQLAVEAKRFSTNARLKARGWYQPTKGGHVNDALRHLYLYLVKEGRLEVPPGVI